MKLHMLLMWLNFLQVAWFTRKECKKTKKERRLRSLVKKPKPSACEKETSCAALCRCIATCSIGYSTLHLTAVT